MDYVGQDNCENNNKRQELNVGNICGKQLHGTMEFMARFLDSYNQRIPD